MKITLILAALFNIGAGLAIIFMFDQIEHWVDIKDANIPLFRLFMGGTAVTFGVAYAMISGSPGENRCGRNSRSVRE